MKEKNTQNAVVPTKDTRQYKYTPKTPKRLISRIFALVACVVLLAIFTITSSAYTIADPDATTLSAHPYAVDVVSFYTTTGKIVIDSPSALALPKMPNYVGGSQIYRYNSVGQGYIDTEFTSINGTVGRADTSLFFALNPSTSHVEFSYDPFYYNPVYGEYLDRIYTRTTDTMLFVRVRTTWREGVNGDYYVINQLVPVDDNFYNIYPQELLGAYYTDPDYTPYIVDFTIEIYPCDDDGDIDLTCVYDRIDIGTRYIMDDTPLDSYQHTEVRVEYEQVVNTRNFSDLLDWLGDVLAGFLSTPLFSVGSLSVSIGTIIATIFGVLFVFLFLRFFSGG